MGRTASALVEDLAHHLRRRIIDGEYGSGDRISELGVSHEYGVARPTARAALEVLVADGLLLRNAYTALRVPDVTSAEIPEILAILDFTEVTALHRIVEMSPDLRDLRETVSASSHSMLDTLVRASGSDRLARFHRRCTFELLLAIHQNDLPDEHPDTGGRSHMQRLVEALFARDATTAATNLAALQAARRTRATAPADTH